MGRTKPLDVRGMLITDTVIGLFSTLVSMRIGDAPLVPILIAGQAYSHSIGTLAHITLLWAYPRVAHWKSVPRWLAVFLVLAFDATVGCALAVVVLWLLGYVSTDSLWGHYRSAYQISLAITFVFGVMGLIAENLKTKLEWATRQHERAVQVATQARLSSLESRIHPHFLFNALNSISSLVREDPDRAERLIERMASLLRFSLDANQLGFVTLSQEIEIVRGYLEIEKARFGERLQYSIDMPDDAATARVPPLSIQTLVENSVKHTVAPRREGGTVSIAATVEGNMLEVHIRDDGPGVDLASAPPGHGIDLLQSRLLVLYEGAASLRSKRSSVILTVPCSVPTLSTMKS
jgi:two-component system, LytTR family, sensor histidine kinase AlgZ